MDDGMRTIEEVLNRFKSDLGDDFDTYKNHACRVYTLCRFLDNSLENAERYAIAAAFHDLGIWVNNTFDYLAPSIQLVRQHLQSIGKEDWSSEVGVMIDMHHKRSKYRGEFEQSVETFRRADWIDVTKGRKSFGVESAVLESAVKRYPTLGFHRFLLKQTVKNFFKNPLSPLPMFKK